MDAYRQEVCSRSKILLQKTIPEKLEQLDLLLQTERLEISFCNEAREFSVSSIKEYEDAIKALELEQREQAEAEQAAATASEQELLDQALLETGSDAGDVPPACKKSKWYVIFYRSYIGQMT